MKKILVIVFTFIFLSGCAKIDTRLSRKLDGTWNITSAIAGGREYVGTEFEAFKYVFNDQGEGMGEMMGIVIFNSDPLRTDIDTIMLDFFIFSDDEKIEYVVLTDPFERDTLEIQELSKKAFRLFQDFQDSSRNVILLGEKE